MDRCSRTLSVISTQKQGTQGGHLAGDSCRIKRMKTGAARAQQLPLAGQRVPCLQAGKALKHTTGDPIRIDFSSTMVLPITV